MRASDVKDAASLAMLFGVAQPEERFRRGFPTRTRAAEKNVVDLGDEEPAPLKQRRRDLFSHWFPSTPQSSSYSYRGRARPASEIRFALHWSA